MPVEWYIGALGEGLEPVVPYIFRIPKGKASLPSPSQTFSWSCSAGVPVPDPLILVHHSLGWFSLQPVRALGLDGGLTFSCYESGC